MKTNKNFEYWLGTIYFIITIVATIVLTILKVTGDISAPWWLVTLPFWGSLAAALLFLGIMALLFLVYKSYEK